MKSIELKFVLSQGRWIDFNQPVMFLSTYLFTHSGGDCEISKLENIGQELTKCLKEAIERVLNFCINDQGYDVILLRPVSVIRALYKYTHEKSLVQCFQPTPARSHARPPPTNDDDLYLIPILKKIIYIYMNYIIIQYYTFGSLLLGS